MKNILILVAFLFVAFSFIGCSDDPVGDITGPAPVDDHHADHDDGLTMEQVNAALGLEEGQHIDFGTDNVAIVCLPGYHAHLPNSPDGVCRTDSGGFRGGRDEEGFSLHGCVEGLIELFINGVFSRCATPESLGH